MLYWTLPERAAATASSTSFTTKSAGCTSELEPGPLKTPVLTKMDRQG